MYYYFAVVQSPGCVWLFEIPWTAASQASLSLTISQSLPNFVSTELVMPSSHLILCHPLLLPPSVFYNVSTVCIRWSKYWSFSFSTVLPRSIQGWFLLRMTGLLSKGLSRVSTTVLWWSAFFIVQLSHPYMTAGKTIALTTANNNRSWYFKGIYLCFPLFTENFTCIFWSNLLNASMK